MVVVHMGFLLPLAIAQRAVPTSGCSPLRPSSPVAGHPLRSLINHAWDARVVHADLLSHLVGKKSKVSCNFSCVTKKPFCTLFARVLVHSTIALGAALYPVASTLVNVRIISRCPTSNSLLVYMSVSTLLTPPSPRRPNRHPDRHRPAIFAAGVGGVAAKTSPNGVTDVLGEWTRRADVNSTGEPQGLHVRET